MTNYSEKNYKDIIKGLRGLREVRAPQELSGRIQKMLIPSLPPPIPVVSPVLALPLAGVSALLVVATSAGILLAAQQTKPGDMLYPVKSTIGTIKNSLVHLPALKRLFNMVETEIKSWRYLSIRKYLFLMKINQYKSRGKN